ncbi:MAG: magnesium transporter MgtE N-terminal domain-containing protein, partial [Bacteroidota bacterium]
MKQFELSKEFLENLQLGIAQENTAFIIAALDGVNVADIAALLDELSSLESIYVLRLLERQLAADVLIELDETTLTKVLP